MVDLEQTSGLASGQDFQSGYVADQKDNPALGCSSRNGIEARQLFKQLDQSNY